MSHETETNIPCPGNAITVYAALEVSGTGWILAVGDPSGTSGTGLHRLEPHDVDGLPGKLARARERAAAASGGPVRVLLGKLHNRTALPAAKTVPYRGHTSRRIGSVPCRRFVHVRRPGSATGQIPA